ncbi:PIN domain-containing protein [Rhizobium sophoriradicis]|uniref:TA system VapC family ribonuclease toxin n=1 Tax=Rhizobium TaxID=379 RepID=UPI00098E88EC|nr:MULTISPECIES: TA system VapC family ribonuclease toxin [Rhizobium]ARQ62212.1 toxin/antitoxin system endonuclease protein VapC 5 [Rhizobium sp. Kim5]RSC20969.1 PIN domain-containing protein [Rhizobium sophoriradicis]
MTFLLDVNVLIALIDPGHVAHDDAHEWFAAIGQTAWATCPITENGVLRIVGNPKYPNSPGSPALVMEIVRKLRSLPGHSFWPDDVSLVGSGDIAPTKILTPGQVTDTYLLALAKARGGQLATFDRKLSAAAVTRGNSALHPIATSRS